MCEAQDVGIVKMSDCPAELTVFMTWIGNVFKTLPWGWKDGQAGHL